MNDELMLLEKDLLRDLTETEKNLLKKLGWRKFISEYLGMNESEYFTLRKITKLISAYCTQTEDVYDAELGSKKHRDLLPLVAITLKCILNDVEREIKSDETPEEDEDPKYRAQLLATLLNEIPENEHIWLEYYLKMVTDYSPIMDIIDDADDYEDSDEMSGDLLDAIKDSVIEACIEELREKETMELPTPILTEVTSAIWHSDENVRIEIKDNKLTVKFK
mgnify:FL=1